MYAKNEYTAYMKQITIRKVSERGLDLARRMAKEQDVPLNEVLRNAVEKGLGVTRSNGLEVYAGDSDFGPEWERYLEKNLNRIDPEMWR